MPISLLALDVSSVCVGWAFFHEGDLQEYGKIQFRKDAEHGEKLLAFFAELQALLAELQPKAVAVEMPYAGRKSNTFGVLMMYIAQVLSAHFGCYGVELPSDGRLGASYVKRVMGVPHQETHAARKEQMVAHINRLYGLNLRYRSTKDRSDDDIADAIAVGHAYLARWSHV